MATRKRSTLTPMLTLQKVDEQMLSVLGGSGVGVKGAAVVVLSKQVQTGHSTLK